MNEIRQKDLFDELLSFQRDNPVGKCNFSHNLDEQQRVENSLEMALYYRDIIAHLINQYYIKEKLPLFSNIMFSTINRCNGNCSFCGANALRDKRPLHVMSDELLEKIVRECKQLEYHGRITMEGLNEPFMDRNMAGRIHYIHQNLPEARIHVITNGTLLTPEIFMTVYPAVSKIHINGYDNRGEQQIIACLKLAETFPDRGRRLKFTKRKSREILAQFGENECGRTQQQILPCSCIIPFNTLSVLPDGKVNLCIADMENQFCLGDISSQSLVEIWYGEKADSFRKKMLYGRRELQLCRTCDMFCF